MEEFVIMRSKLSSFDEPLERSRVMSYGGEPAESEHERKDIGNVSNRSEHDRQLPSGDSSPAVVSGQDAASIIQVSSQQHDRHRVWHCDESLYAPSTVINRSERPYNG